MTRSRAIALSGLACLALAGCGASASSGQASSARPRPPTVAGAPPTTTSTVANAARVLRRHRRRPAPDPGLKPQTDQLPSSQTRAFRGEMRALWTAVLTDHAAAGVPAFFPVTAYTQLKSIGDAAADWRYRLLADYELDIAAAHALLGTPPAGTELVGVTVPEAYAHWVTPGVCENQVGYYEVPNARMVYREGGVVRSFGIASMISWRGRWYVIHLGYVGRLSVGGRVDAPSVGPGSSAPLYTC
ncbi:MAG TPA: hypothetical protein VF781_08930 [Solirubrobacteraceae bacterium]